MERPLAQAHHIRPPRRTDRWARASRAFFLVAFGAVAAQGMLRLFQYTLPKAGPDTMTLVAVPPPATTYPMRVRETDWSARIEPSFVPCLPANLSPTIEVTGSIQARSVPDSVVQSVVPAPVRVAPPRVRAPRFVPPKPVWRERRATTLSNKPYRQEKPFRLPASLLPID